MQKWQHQCTIISLIKVSYLHGYNWAINVICTTKEVWSSFLSQFPTITVIKGLIPRGRNLPPSLSLPKSPADQVAGAYPAWRNPRSGWWRCQTTSGLWADVHAGSAPISHLWDLDLGGGPNGATTRSELIPRSSVAPFIDTLSTHVNPGQPNFHSPKAGRQPLSIQRAVWLAYNLLTWAAEVNS